MKCLKLNYLLLFFAFATPLSAFKNDDEVTQEERDELRIAAEQNNLLEISRLVLTVGINPNSRDGTREARMPMHHATSPEMVVLLCSLGAELNPLDAYGMTPLHVAAFAFENEVVAQLLTQGANHLIEDADGHLPWDLTTRWCPDEVRRRLANGIEFEGNNDQATDNMAWMLDDVPPTATRRAAVFW